MEYYNSVIWLTDTTAGMLITAIFTYFELHLDLLCKMSLIIYTKLHDVYVNNNLNLMNYIWNYISFNAVSDFINSFEFKVLLSLLFFILWISTGLFRSSIEPYEHGIYDELKRAAFKGLYKILKMILTEKLLEEIITLLKGITIVANTPFGALLNGLTLVLELDVLDPKLDISLSNRVVLFLLILVIYCIIHLVFDAIHPYLIPGDKSPLDLLNFIMIGLFIAISNLYRDINIKYLLILFIVLVCLLIINPVNKNTGGSQIMGQEISRNENGYRRIDPFVMIDEESYPDLDEDTGIIYIKEMTPLEIAIEEKGDVSENFTVELSVEVKETKKVDADIVVVVDSSASMFQVDEEKLRKKAIEEFMNLLDPEKIRIGLIFFNDKPFKISPLKDNFDEVRTLLSNMPDESGGTDFSAALKAAIELLDESPDKRIRSIVLLTDALPEGEGEQGYNFKKEDVEECKRKGYKLHTIGIRPHKSSINDLEYMADHTDGICIIAKGNNANQAIFPILRDLAKIIQYEVVATETKLVDILPAYLKQPWDFTFQTPYEYIDMSHKAHRPCMIVGSKTKNKTIVWPIGPLVACNSSWKIAFKTKYEPYLPISWSVGLRHEENNSVLTYRDPKGKLVMKQIPTKYLKLKALGFWAIIGLSVKKLFRLG